MFLCLFAFVVLIMILFFAHYSVIMGIFLQCYFLQAGWCFSHHVRKLIN